MAKFSDDPIDRSSHIYLCGAKSAAIGGPWFRKHLSAGYVSRVERVRENSGGYQTSLASALAFWLDWTLIWDPAQRYDSRASRPPFVWTLLSTPGADQQMTSMSATRKV